MKITNLTIKTGANFKIETNNPQIACKQNSNQLIIKEKHKWFSTKNDNDLIIYIPKEMMFETVEIDTGAGNVTIEKLETKKISFDIGAGEVKMKHLNVTEEAKIDSGAGKVEILSSSIKNLDLDVGVGKFILNAKLSGKNDIDAGVGELDINLTDGIENYTIRANKGIGSISLAGKEVSENIKYGEGDTYIEIEGGIGAIDIK